MQAIGPKMRRYPTPLHRVKANACRAESGCWLWLGSVTRNRSKETFYGRLSVRGPDGRVHRVFAHRYALAASLGIPEGYIEVARHKCDVPLCVNPAHLEPGTQKQNMADRARRHR